MTTVTTINYSDLYPGVKPQINALLEGINSKTVVVFLAVINSELSGPGDIVTVQNRITGFATASFPPAERQRLAMVTRQLQQKTNEGPVVLWGKRYILAFMQREFLHYREGAELSTSSDDEFRIFKAYLLIAEQENLEDRAELASVRKQLGANDPFTFEKICWPFILKQFENNHRANPASQLYMVFAMVKNAMDHPQLRSAWKTIIERNGFTSLRVFLGSFYSLLTITQKRFPKGPFKVFSWVMAKDIPPHLLNLSFDHEEFRRDPKKQINYLGIKEKPLFNCGEKGFAVLDIDFLISRAYMGTVFELYYKGGLEGKPPFKIFPDFKSYLAKHVSEEITFQSLFSHLFEKRNAFIEFDDGSVDGQPDCLLVIKDAIFLIEFKDYLFPGTIVEAYAFDQIKAHIDEKFVRSKGGQSKGLSQIVNQIKTLPESTHVKKHNTKAKKLKIYPVIVHTNFMYQMPGVSHYLNAKFREQMLELSPDPHFAIQDLTLIDQETLFEMLPLKKIDAYTLRDFLDRYHRILRSRAKHFLSKVNQDNFVASRASFDEIFHSIILPKESKVSSQEHGNRLTDSLGLTDAVLDSF